VVGKLWKEGRMLGHVLNTIGLLLGMAGVAVIFHWGPPQPTFEEAVPLALEHGTVFRDGTKVSDIIEAARQRKKTHKIMSNIGLALIFLGFAVQLWAMWA
jgi:hypothetical protein